MREELQFSYQPAKHQEQGQHAIMQAASLRAWYVLVVHRVFQQPSRFVMSCQLCLVLGGAAEHVAAAHCDLREHVVAEHVASSTLGWGSYSNDKINDAL
jgi:hypothetical protein